MPSNSPKPDIFVGGLPHYPDPKNPAPSSTSQQPNEMIFSVTANPAPSNQAVAAAGDMSMAIILAAFGGAIVLLIVAISIVALMIIVHKYRVRRQKAWSVLNEQQKVDRMKESGYINPTYQFFDQVTQ